MSITIRLRHPRGVSTLDLDPESTTIEELRSMIFSQTEIVPSAQELKFGYPPKPLPLDESKRLSEIPITKGEQIVVTESHKKHSTVVSHSNHVSVPPSSGSVVPTQMSGSEKGGRLGVGSMDSKGQGSGTSSKTADKTPVVVELQDGNGVMNHVIVPDDNSCLFTSLAVIFLGGQDEQLVSALRQVVAEAIRSNPMDYPDVVLGRPREEYISTILKPQSWGGAIELAVFAKHFSTEIDSFDVLSGRADRFGEGSYDSRCVLVYSGIHYDAVTTSPMRDAPPEFQTTVFPISDPNILPAAQELVKKLKDQRYYTDTAGFDLRCQICKAGLKGEKEARAHAKATGHVDFGEY